MHIYVYQCVYSCVSDMGPCISMYVHVCVHLSVSLCVCMSVPLFVCMSERQSKLMLGMEPRTSHSIKSLNFTPSMFVFYINFRPFSSITTVQRIHIKRRTLCMSYQVTARHFFYSRSLLSSLKSLVRSNLLLIPFDLEELFFAFMTLAFFRK